MAATPGQQLGGIGIRRYPLIWFFVLAWLFSWWTAPLMGGSIFPYGPSIAAVVVIGMTRGRTGLREWWHSLNRWGVAARWYLIGPGLIALYLLIAFVIGLALGLNPTPDGLDTAAFPLVVLQLLFLGGMWEEPGWTGYALPELQERLENQPYGLLRASLMLGVMRGIWHLPLVFYGHIPWYDAVIFSLAFQFILTWLYNRTQSVPVVMTAHFASNVLGGAIMLQLFEEPDLTTYYILVVATASVLAIVFDSRGRWSMGRDTRPIPVPR